MSAPMLFSAPNELYKTHIERCLESFNLLFPKFYVPLAKVLRLDREDWSKEALKRELREMIKYHDLGKLARKWQENLGTGNKLPAHAPIGACYLWHTVSEDLRGPLSFAVAIHHTDRGLLGDNIECPDVLAVLDGIVGNDGYIEWAGGVEILGDYVPEDLKLINVSALKKMARGLRLWARGCSILEQHRRRMCASLIHHLLKLCDISAATKRDISRKKDERDLYGGWLMVSNISKFVENVSARDRRFELIKELHEYIQILISEYNPEKIILFGSLALGNINPTSDIDLVIIMDTEKSFLDRIKDILERLQPRVGADFLVYTPGEFSEMTKRSFFKKEIVEKGRVIYERRVQKMD